MSKLPLQNLRIFTQQLSKKLNIRTLCEINDESDKKVESVKYNF